jgi:hypothetical protein
MHLDSYRWQDHVLNRYRRGIDLAVTGFFALALSLGAVMNLGGDRAPAPSAASFAPQTAMYHASHGQIPAPASPGCGA